MVCGPTAAFCASGAVLVNGTPAAAAAPANAVVFRNVLRSCVIIASLESCSRSRAARRAIRGASLGLTSPGRQGRAHAKIADEGCLRARLGCLRCSLRQLGTLLAGLFGSRQVEGGVDECDV